MKRLLIDKGNTRLKWKLLASNDWDQGETCRGSLQDFNVWLNASDITNTWVDLSAVSDVEPLLALLNQQGSVEVRKYQSEAARDGLVNSYQHPQRMGIDRWLAMLAAKEQCITPSFIVVDAGTAFTLDVVQQGVHQGGYILPGVLMAQDALYGKTDQVHRYSEHQEENINRLLGKNTVQCVEYGILNQLLALTRQVQQDFSGLPIILTGGDAPLLAPHLNNCTVDAELVLKGLFVIGKE